MDMKKIVRELVHVARSLVGKFPPKALDYNKVPDADGFWSMRVEDAQRSYSLRLNPKEIGDVIFFLNMAAEGWSKANKNQIASDATTHARKADYGDVPHYFNVFDCFKIEGRDFQPEDVKILSEILADALTDMSRGFEVVVRGRVLHSKFKNRLPEGVSVV